MRLSEVRDAIHEVLHYDRPHSLATRLYDKLNEVLGTHVDEVSPYGYLKYLISKFGDVAKYPNCVLSTSAISQFHKVSLTAAEDFLTFVAQGAERLESLVAMFSDSIEWVLDGLCESADPAVVYTVLTAVREDFNDPVVDRKIEELKPEAIDYFRKYPIVLSKLPEDLKKGVIHGNIGRAGVCTTPHAQIQGDS